MLQRRLNGGGDRSRVERADSSEDTSARGGRGVVRAGRRSVRRDRPQHRRADVLAADSASAPRSSAAATAWRCARVRFVTSVRLGAALQSSARKSQRRATLDRGTRNDSNRRLVHDRRRASSTAVRLREGRRRGRTALRDEPHNVHQNEVHRLASGLLADTRELSLHGPNGHAEARRGALRRVSGHREREDTGLGPRESDLVRVCGDRAFELIERRAKRVHEPRNGGANGCRRGEKEPVCGARKRGAANGWTEHAREHTAMFFEQTTHETVVSSAENNAVGPLRGRGERSSRPTGNETATSPALPQRNGHEVRTGRMHRRDGRGCPPCRRSRGTHPRRSPSLIDMGAAASCWRTRRAHCVRSRPNTRHPDRTRRSLDHRAHRALPRSSPPRAGARQ